MRIERPSLAGLGAAVIAGGMTAVYLLTISTQDSPHSSGRTSLVAGTLAGAASLSAAGAAARQAPVRLALLSAAATALLVWGFLGIFSIGLPLCIAALLAGYGAMTESRHVRPKEREVAVVVAIAVVAGTIIGLMLT